MSIWKNERLEDKIIKILKDVNFKPNQNHHFGKPFLTPYQLAFELKKRYPETVENLNSCKDIGGEGSGNYNSLPQYLAGQISQHYQSMKARGVEGAFLSGNDLKELIFDRDIKSSVRDVSLFRYNRDFDESQ
ncbi:hypothetical protein CACET_c27100 [Clostridium aceticum]|uniref:Uncharacterized protein n=1 Tax=Clostridium aceticum TaxID=84022 RepID=A0A0D8I975_9CLOT|nr:hypothetical protein [Clostridium aceticum]AKL96155.1 hypothetical protein CACET_c27100 [Clostridium aceticum]KJF26577.1 hypothetical protein TZ02_11925 [Clostridium aceticum]